MLTISLDEYGSFEGGQGRRCMIGGILYDGPEGQREQEQELTRINRYLQDACAACKARFPQDLHFEWRETHILNRDTVNAVKDYIAGTFADFLRGAEPQGRYYIYALCGMQGGVSQFQGDGVGNLLRDSYAGNLYLHMAGMALHNLLVNNPILQADRYHLELATRVMKPGENDALRQQSKTLGYSDQNRGTSGGEIYGLTNVNSYISLLSSIMLENENKNVAFKLNVQSINYRESPVSFKQGFLYLADIVCSLLQDSLSGSSPTVERLTARANQFTTHKRNMIWSYSDTDILFQNSIRLRIEGSWFDSLSLLYDATHRPCPEARHYQAFWAERALQKFREERTPQKLAQAAEALRRSLSLPNASASKGWYIARRLESLLDQQDSSAYDACKYALYSSLMTLCNHRGLPEEAQRYYRLCTAYAQYVPIDAYLELRNTYSVSLLDQLHFDEAYENTKETLAYEELAEEIRRTLYPHADGAALHYGMTLSQLGQACAFRGDHSQAQALFRQALEKFGQDTVNLQITRSFLLHSYIEHGDRAEYEALSRIYFGADTPAGQFDALEKLEATSRKFALFVWVKGLRRFGLENTPKGTIQRFLDRIARIREADAGEHPWELTVRHCALLALEKGLPKQAERFFQRLQSFEAASPLLSSICRDGLEEYACAQRGEPFIGQPGLTYMYR